MIQGYKTCRLQYPQCNKHLVTSLEAVSQISCSFLWSHKRIYTTLVELTFRVETYTFPPLAIPRGIKQPTGQNRSLFIHLVNNGNVETNRNVARLPAFVFPGDFVAGGRQNCSVKMRLIGNQSKAPMTSLFYSITFYNEHLLHNDELM